MKQTYTLEDLPKIANDILYNSKSNVILLNGEMGAGKTTLIKELVKQLGVTDVVSSPTFSLVNEYHSTTGEIMFHFDFYRIESEEEALDMGIEDYLYNDSMCFIEWGENVQNLLPLDITNVNIAILNESQRTIEIKNDE